MKKIMLTTAVALAALSASTANADSLRVSIGAAPVYRPVPVYQPAPVVYEPAPAYYGPPAYYPTYYSGRDRHRNYDWRYWHEREKWEREHRPGVGYYHR